MNSKITPLLKLLLPVILITSFGWSQVNITFQVDMSFEIINEEDSVHIAGSFQGWDPAATVLVDEDGDLIYSTTVEITEDTIYYKYVNGDEWGEEENIGSDRILVVPETDTVLDLVCFGSQDPCPETPDSIAVTFIVDMQFEDVSSYGVHIAGNFQNWSTSSSEMLDNNGDEKYEITFSFIPGEELHFKFINGDSWVGGETVPDACAHNGNRLIIAPNIDRSYEYCFGTCGTCPVDPVTKIVVFSVDMTEWLDEDGATGMPVFSVSRGDQMQVKASFNGWDCDIPDDCEMSRIPGTNIFSLAVPLTDFPDDDFEYKYFLELDSSSYGILEERYGPVFDYIGWEDPPTFGGSNRHFTLGEDDGTGLLELGMEGYFDLPAGAVIPEGQVITLTFSVDMNSADEDNFNADEDTVYVVLHDKWMNYIQGFEDNSRHLATPNGDGTYSININFTGPVPWHMIYSWRFYDFSENVGIEEGGGFGFGRFRARYFHADSNQNCAWVDYSFPQDQWTKNPPLVVEDFAADDCVTMSIISNITPSVFSLSENFPNPFNPVTNFIFDLPFTSDVTVNIYNVLGQHVATLQHGQLNAGSYQITWNGRDHLGQSQASGIYFYELRVDENYQQIKKMTLLK